MHRRCSSLVSIHRVREVLLLLDQIDQHVDVNGEEDPLALARFPGKAGSLHPSARLAAG